MSRASRNTSRSADSGWSELAFPASLSPLRGLFVFRSSTHSLRPFDRLRAGCGLYSFAASRLANEKLRALLFEDDLGFPGRLLFSPVGAGYVAQRSRRLRNGTKFPERAFALRVGVASTTDQWSFGRHGVHLGVLRMAGRLNHLRLVGQRRDSGLSEGGAGPKAGKENEKDDHCDFHSVMARGGY